MKALCISQNLLVLHNYINITYNFAVNESNLIIILGT